jgi:GNAT superfamily N-acetyltransferase
LCVRYESRQSCSYNPKMNLTITVATRNDLQTIVDLVRALAIYEKLEHLMVSTPADFERELFEPNARIECVIAREGETPVGFALYFHNFSTFLGRKGLYLEDLFVIPEARGKGYGKALLIHLANIAVERNCGRFEWSVLDWNEPSIKFYESMGATVLPDWRIVRATGDKLDGMAAQ